ncbi:hypothetical protein PMNALOAF_1835 [Methylobacterium adhaesivum]|uniref:AAA family ATPase n=1 Tax=Methylobacterium adhaesivum TaxID=333297 RepID=A0ABT8BCE5_9HYPH|nr:AAA family ATPase [Methylobacterium adhaesivum]MDN3589573.1 AAA family ATPase [Methylobacterium adhaesivum]GJD30588.1 hypothetical protein PMNALOAF_1835 [Methylobacterium adhaesivum]
MSTPIDNKQFSGFRLSYFSVVKLFDEFTYEIPLNNDKHVTAIIAPNGMGKTLCLRMIDGFFSNRWSIFSETVFESALFRFTNGCEVEVKKSKPSKEDSDDALSHARFEVVISTLGSDDPIVWRPKPDDRRVFTPERYLPFLTRVGSSRWRHDHTGETFNITEILELFGEQLPQSFRSSIYGKKPILLENIITEVHCRLIETQRLLILKERPTNKVYYGHQANSAKSTLAIAQKAETLKAKISKEINDYAALSQSLDRSFPRRVIQQSTDTYVRTSIAIEELKARLQDLDKQRDELTRAGILDAEADQPVALPPGDISTDIASVLQVYADDTQKKLSSLSRILEKINLFKRLIDQRFITKDVTISKKNGIDVTFHGSIVPLEKLSSGEQHQLVLFFELLFEIEGNSLILIDEPELSLHVAWQKKFISDLMEIIKLNRFDVILATHSPQLVGRWNDLVVELGDVDPDDDESEHTAGAGTIDLLEGEF